MNKAAKVHLRNAVHGKSSCGRGRSLAEVASLLERAIDMVSDAKDEAWKEADDAMDDATGGTIVLLYSDAAEELLKLEVERINSLARFHRREASS